MKKKGPCLHCGITSTPLWRNGPPEKAVLCNACGSQYKVKGHLDDGYLPKIVQNLKNIKDENGESVSHLNDGTGSSSRSKSTKDDHDHHISAKDFGKKAPSNKQSRVEHQEMSPILEEFHEKLLDLYESEMEGKEPDPEDDLVDNVNNFIPSNEIGLGVTLLKIDWTWSHSYMLL